MPVFLGETEGKGKGEAKGADARKEFDWDVEDGRGGKV